MSNIPFVTCSNCGREAMCIQTKDGIVYRPAAWTFDGPDALRGLCGECFAAVAVLLNLLSLVERP